MNLPDLSKIRRGVVIAATLDVKSAEVGYVQRQLEHRGQNVIIINCGILGDATIHCHITSEEVANAGGVTLAELRRRHDRASALPVMHDGLAAIMSELVRLDKVSAYFGVGGGTNAAFAGTAFRSMPYGVPKVLVSTRVSGDVRNIVGISDAVLMHSVVDILGLNPFLIEILNTATGLIIAMIRETPAASSNTSWNTTTAMTTFGCTTEAASHALKMFEERNVSVLAFHARGTGGQAAEAFIRAGRVSSVLDLTTTEIADEIVGGVRSAGPDRLSAAGEMRLPQVVLPGAIDVVNFGSRETIPAKFSHRKFLMHNPSTALMRTTPQENVAIAEFIAGKLNNAKGPAAVVIPLNGFSAYDKKGEPFFDPEADRAFSEALTSHLHAKIDVVFVDAHLNDRKCMEVATGKLSQLIAKSR